MTEAAATASTGINPNVPVGAESETQSKANSSVSFDDVADQPVEKKPKPKLVKEEKGEESKVRGKNKEEGTSFEDAADEPKKKAEPKAKEAAKDDKAAAEKPRKAKVHKIKAGDSTIDLPGDALVTVTVDGKDEEMTFDDFRSQVSGRVNWDRKNNELHRERQGFVKEKEQLNGLVKNLFEKATSGDPESAWDFLAEISKQDAAKLKIGILRKQFEEMAPLFEMSADERERWFKERELDWRDKAHVNREKSDKEREALAAQEAERAQVSERYGIDEDTWIARTKMVHEYLGRVDPKFDGKVTPDQVLWADRHVMALEEIAKTVPHLEKHEKFDSIVSDIVQNLIRHPEMTRAKLASLLTDVWAEDKDKGLKNLARKAAKSADVSEPVRSTSKSTSRDPVNFDDLED